MKVLLHRTTVVLLSLAFAAPLLWMVAVSLFPAGTGLAENPLEVVHDPEWTNYGDALRRMGRTVDPTGGTDGASALKGFWRLFLNTSLVTVLSMVGQVFTCSLAGYAFACLRFRGRDFLFVLVLSTMMLPPQVVTIPQFLLYRGLGLVDTFVPLVLPTFLGGAPFFIFLYRQAFLSLSPDVREAARLDGAGPFRVFFSVMFPLVRPVTATVAVFTFLATWNDFWAPLVYLSSGENQTLALALASFNRGYDTSVEAMMAASAVVLAPCLVVYFLFQKLFLRGISLAASKG